MNRRLLVKVCGMRHDANIQAVDALGVDLMGFIFHPASPRFVDVPPACLPRRAARVGVFVDADLPAIERRVDEFGLVCVQLHGAEPPSLCQALRARGLRVIKAFGVSCAADLQPTARYAHSCDFFLFDTRTPAHGGSGQQFEWGLLEAYASEVPFLLSGGLRPGLEQALLSFSHPRWAGVDLNSGFELSPGLKDVARLATFLQRLRGEAPQDIE